MLYNDASSWCLFGSMKRKVIVIAGCVLFTLVLLIALSPSKGPKTTSPPRGVPTVTFTYTMPAPTTNPAPTSKNFESGS